MKILKDPILVYSVAWERLERIKRNEISRQLHKFPEVRKT